MKKSLLLLLFLNVMISSAQPLNFANKANMPSARSGSALADYGDFAYIVGGFSATEPYTSEIYQYNFATDTWTTFSTNIPLIPKRYANAEILNGKLYVFNGETATGVNNKLEIIDLFTGEVTMGADNPNPVSQGGSGVDRLYNEIIAFGGCNDSATATYSSKINYYDYVLNTWNEGVIYSMSTSTTTKGRMINAKLYYLGGYAENNLFREDFETAATTGNLAITNWTNVAETGTKLYQGKTFSSNIYAQASAFDANILTREASNKIWLISNDIEKPADSE